MPLRLVLLGLLQLQCLCALESLPWDVAIGRRPYIAEATGELLLRTPGFLGKSVEVKATLPCISRNWTWNVTGGPEVVLSLGNLSSMPQLINNDMMITVTVNGQSVTKRRRFIRAFKSDMANTVQVDHSTTGLLVDGKPWAGFGWYQYAYESFVPRWCSDYIPRPIHGFPWSPETAKKHLDCTLWGIGNETEALADYAKRGVNLVMPYALNPFTKNSIIWVDDDMKRRLVLNYFDTAAKHSVKVMLYMADIMIQGSTNFTLEMLASSVALVKDHPALLGYYICDDCQPYPNWAKTYNTVKALDPYHLIAGATFGGHALASYTDNAVSAHGTSDDKVPILPSLTPTDQWVPCTGRAGKKTCKAVDAPLPHTLLSMDYQMVENYDPSPEAHVRRDFGALRAGAPWEPVVNCDGSYTLFEIRGRKKPPKVLLSNMWISTVVANTVSQVVFAATRPAPMESMDMNSNSWEAKSSWMLFNQVELYSAQVRAILPSLYAPFGLAQPSVQVTRTALIIEQSPAQGWPSGHSLAAKAWRQASEKGGWCGHLVVASSFEQSPVSFTLQLGGSSPLDKNLRALRMFDADYVVPISANGTMVDVVDAAGVNIYQLGDCVGTSSTFELLV